MTMQESTGSAVVYVAGEPLFLAKDQGGKGKPLIQYRQVPTQEGDPTKPQRRRINDWSRGLGDSRGVYQGAVEHCEYAFLGRMGRILPSHLINSVTSFVAHSADITCIEEVTAPANRILVGGGTKVSEINPSTHTLATSHTVTGGGVLSMCLYIDVMAIALGDSQDFEYRNNAGTYAVNSLGKKARCFGISGEGDLARGASYNWSKCTEANFYSVDNWSTDYAIGDKSHLVNQVFGHNQNDYVLKDEGLYTFVQANSKEANVLTDLVAFASSENRAYGRWSDWIFVCSRAGLWRVIQQGAARPVGAECHTLSESALQNTYPTAFQANGVWAYEARYDAVNDLTYLCMLRRAEDGDASMLANPVTTVSILDKFTGKCRAMHISSLSGTPELYYAKATSVAYIKLTPDGKPSEFQTANTTKVWMPPTDLGSPMTVKYFRSIEAIGRNFGSVQFKAAMDGGSYNNVGTALSSLSSSYGQKFWTLASNDHGRVMQLEADLTNASSSAPAEIRDIFVGYEERPVMTDGAVYTFRCRDGDAEQGVSAPLDALGTRQRIEALIDGAPFTFVDENGQSFTAAFTAARGEVDYQRFGLTPQTAIQVVMRKLSYA